MRQRTITAVFFAAAMIGGIFGGRYPFLWLFVVITAGSLWELMGLMLDKERFFGFRRVMGCIVGILPVLICGEQFLASGFCGHSTMEEMIGNHASAHLELSTSILAITVFFIFLQFIIELFLGARSPFGNIAIYLLGLFYIGIPICMLYSLATAPVYEYHPNRVFGLLWLIWTNDTMAYLIGSRIGKTKLFERISPKKTWEGTIGGALCTIAMAWLISLYVNDLGQTQWLALGLVVAVFGNLGDLVESMLKRSVGVKDSGNLLPGHGGLLDRFDSFIFILPFAWLVVQFL